MKIFATMLSIGLLPARILAQTSQPTPSCATLASLTLPQTTITMAQPVPAGGFTPPGSTVTAAQTVASLRAFCRIAGTLKPSSDSDIKIEVWLPTSGWNGKLQAVGNGGWAGSISYGAMAEALRRGYATTSTDTGIRRSTRPCWTRATASMALKTA